MGDAWLQSDGAGPVAEIAGGDIQTPPAESARSRFGTVGRIHAAARRISRGAGSQRLERTAVIGKYIWKSSPYKRISNKSATDQCSIRRSGVLIITLEPNVTTVRGIQHRHARID